MQTPKTKMLTLLVIPLLLIPIVSVGAAHWYDTITKQYKLKVGRLDTKIISYKILTPCDVYISKWPPDCQMPTKTISISTKVFPGWYCWIGLKIQNFAPVPVCIDGPTFNVYDPNGVWQYFIHQEYYYGQVIDGTSYGWSPTDVPQNVYAWVKLNPNQPWQVAPPPPGNITGPVTLEAYGPHTKNTMIMWIFLKLPKNIDLNTCKGFKLKICLTITSTMCCDNPPTISSYTWESPP
ncbi:MAG: hypothetical protein QXN36_00310 [Candidatus Bathyarchaeia archaeon]